MIQFEHSTQCYLRQPKPMARQTYGKGSHTIHAGGKDLGEQNASSGVPRPTMNINIRQDIIITRARAILSFHRDCNKFLRLCCG